MDAEKLGLGRIIPEGVQQQRDAIHIAVAPLVAGVHLSPGQRVQLGEDELVYPDSGKAVGVVDPFLQDTVEKGQRFWLFLFPGTITSLRHDWTHPAFAPKVLRDYLAKKKVENAQ